MPDQPDAITRLRKASYALEDLPETIAFLTGQSTVLPWCGRAAG